MMCKLCIAIEFFEVTESIPGLSFIPGSMILSFLFIKSWLQLDILVLKSILFDRMRFTGLECFRASMGYY